MMQRNFLSRRDWLAMTSGAMTSGALVFATGADRLCGADSKPKRPRVAAIVTEMTHRSHAHVILENFLEKYYFNGKLTDPGMDVVSMYVDQFPRRDMARDVAKQYKIAIYPSIADALRAGGSDLAVDGVLSIGEHGNYPNTDRGQRMYPRKRFFDEIAAVFRQNGRAVPLFNDKHLSYRFDWSAEMMQVAKELNIPFMAGSSVPLAQRRPPLEMPSDAVIEEAVSIHSGPLEAYDFHALEVLQSMVEFRRGGETGVANVQLLQGEAAWEAAKQGKWNYNLAVSAMKAQAGTDVGPLEDFKEPNSSQRHPAHVILINYRDGLRATVLRIGNSSTRWAFACRIAGSAEPLATSYYVGPWENRNLFKALSHAIQTHIREGRAPYPVERTHLVTGVLASAMDSRFEGHRLVDTPHLDIRYQPQDFRAMREMGETWKILTEDLPQPDGINPGGPR